MLLLNTHTSSNINTHLYDTDVEGHTIALDNNVIIS